ncbi:MAG: hypothetical protein KKH94_12810 [Candidatus Omnitrophica bacterium]|nr:hypothetical protein [Candidatus Omnitrophota bacterium]
MKKRYILFFFLFLCATAFAASGQKVFVIDDFAKKYAYNFTGGINRDFFNGTLYTTTPWCISKVVTDKKRATALKLEYDVATGEAGYEAQIRDKTLFQRFDAIAFYVRGDTDTFKIEIHGKDVHEYLVDEVDEVWKKVVIPFDTFSKYLLFSPQSIYTVRFVFESESVSKQQGTVYIDDIKLILLSTERIESRKLNPPSKIVAINSKPVSMNPYKASLLSLRARYNHDIRKHTFRGIRFEASYNRKYWFFVGEDFTKKGNIFSAVWDAQSFEKGTYWLRAVAIYKDKGRSEGNAVRIKIENDFNFDDFIDQLERKSFRYFLYEKDSTTGLIKEDSAPQAYFSTKACGLALAAFCVGAERSFISRTEASRSVLSILDTFINRIPDYHGFYPEYVDKNFTPLPEESGDIIATSYLIAGARVAFNYFQSRNDNIEKAVRWEAQKLMNSVQWKYALVQEEEHVGLLAEKIYKDKTKKGILAGYQDGMIAYILALSSSVSPVSPLSWDAWAKTYSFSSYEEYTVLMYPSLFAHQMPHVWLNLKGMKDTYADYFDNTIKATLINREFSLKENAYAKEIWGLTACVGPHGYREYGAPPPKSNVLNDGTICPSASASSIVFTPTLSKAALYALYKTYGYKLLGKYGFYESFNPKEKYFKEFYTAVNVGAIVLQTENYRSGLIWELFMKDSRLKSTLRRIGFKEEL